MFFNLFYYIFLANLILAAKKSKTRFKASTLESLKERPKLQGALSPVKKIKNSKKRKAVSQCGEEQTDVKKIFKRQFRKKRHCDEKQQQTKNQNSNNYLQVSNNLSEFLVGLSDKEMSAFLTNLSGENLYKLYTLLSDENYSKCVECLTDQEFEQVDRRIIEFLKKSENIKRFFEKLKTNTSSQ